MIQWLLNLIYRLLDPKGTSEPVKQRVMLTQDEFARRLRTWRESAEGQEIEDLLIAAAIDEVPEGKALALLDTPPPPLPERPDSYMIASAEFDAERVIVEFAMPIPVAAELIGHTNQRDEYEEAQDMVNEFMDRLSEVMAKALFGA